MGDLTHISNLVFEVKEKLTDGEFKELMDKLSEFRMTQKKKFYKVWYIQPNITEECDDGRVQVNASFDRKSMYVELDQNTADTINEELEEKGSYSMCHHMFLRISGGNCDEYDDDIMQYIPYNDDQILTFERHCSMIVKLELQ